MGYRSEVAAAQALDALATTLEAGVPLSRVLCEPLIARTLPPDLAAALRQVDGGATLARALTTWPTIGAAELAIIEAGELGGRLPDALRRAAATTRRRADVRGEVGKALRYPAALVFLSTVVTPIPTIVFEGVGAYVAQAIWGPAIVISVFAVFWLWLPSLSPRDPRRARVGELFGRLPGFGGIQRRLATATFARVLGLCIESGLPIARSLELAGASAGSASLDAVGRKAATAASGGQTLAASIDSATRGSIDPAFLSVVAQGEIGGTLDRSLAAFADRQEAEATVALRTAIRTLVALATFAVMLVAAWQIVRAFQQVLSEVDAAIDAATH
ncbi:MAG: type II secretion system F family protein [Myxococcales bacterium]|nr:type II secretion system F family protein [Myxococcales bacterium]MCB9534402.1 type II secretion system F family protein [Myxococcales bacterium]